MLNVKAWFRSDTKRWNETDHRGLFILMPTMNIKTNASDKDEPSLGVEHADFNVHLNFQDFDLVYGCKPDCLWRRFDDWRRICGGPDVSLHLG